MTVHKRCHYKSAIMLFAYTCLSLSAFLVFSASLTAHVRIKLVNRGLLAVKSEVVVVSTGRVTCERRRRVSGALDRGLLMVAASSARNQLVSMI